LIIKQNQAERVKAHVKREESNQWYAFEINFSAQGLNDERGKEEANEGGPTAEESPCGQTMSQDGTRFLPLILHVQ
jgi:hypothetical protein